MWGSRLARGAERRPERGAKRRTEAGAEPRGPGGVPRHGFQYCPAIMKKSSAISKEVQAISKIHAISQKNVAISIIANAYLSKSLDPGIYDIHH